MKAAVLREFKAPLSIEDVDLPQINQNEVLIRVEACGVCHSDLHVADGDWPQIVPITKRPLILGHEVAGQVMEIGNEVTRLKVGDRVGVPWVHWTCGECEFCREGHENLCSKQKITGVTVDGGYAEYMKAPASHAQQIPAGLSCLDAAPLFCAGVTVYRALKRAKIKPGERLAVFGIGGLGHLAVQIGHGLGASVTAVDVSEEKLERAKEWGAAVTINSATSNVVKEIRRAGGVHVALVTSAAKAAYDTAFPCVRPTGSLLVVGLPAEAICFPAIQMAALEIHVQASSVGTREDTRELLELAASGRIHTQVAPRPLAEVNNVLAKLREGSVSGRIVIVPH